MGRLDGFMTKRDWFCFLPDCFFGFSQVWGNDQFPETGTKHQGGLSISSFAGRPPAISAVPPFTRQFPLSGSRYRSISRRSGSFRKLSISFRNANFRNASAGICTAYELKFRIRVSGAVFIWKHSLSLSFYSFQRLSFRLEIRNLHEWF